SFFFRCSLVDHLVQRAAELCPVVIERVVVRNRSEIATPARNALSVFFGEELRFRAKPDALRVDLRDAGKTLPTAIEKDHVIWTDFHDETGVSESALGIKNTGVVRLTEVHRSE